MVELSTIIKKYPECVDDTKKLKAYLNDMYTSYDDRIISEYLVLVSESGFPAEIIDKDELKYAQYRKYVDNIAVTTGMDVINAEKATKVWMDALSVQIGKIDLSDSSIPADHIHKYHKTIVPSNCTQKGYTKYWCDCGYEYTGDYTRPLACRFTIVEQKNATCTKEGYVKSCCTGCGKEKEEIIPKITHAFGNWNIIFNATCLSEGKRSRKCSVCGMEESEAISIMPHDFGGWHEQIHPLCECEGKSVRVCKLCKTVEAKPLPAIGHKWEEWIETPDGKQLSRFCSQCGKEEYKEKIEYDPDEFIIEDGVLKKYKGKESIVTIPSCVTRIGDWAFHGCRYITQITIPNSVIHISEGAFYSCSSLTEITIPNSVKHISNSAFCHCDNLKTVVISNSITCIASNTFHYCKSLNKIHIPNSVTSIDYQSFANCDSLIEITIPNSVTNIANQAFYGCNNLQEVVLPAITKIAVRTFPEKTVIKRRMHKWVY